MRGSRRKSRKDLRRKSCVGISLAAYLFATLGLPMPATAISRDDDQPFPCQGSVCGCRTAEQCWRSCCCHSADQRWVWAQEHDVQPPSYAEQPTSGWRSTRKRDQVPEQTKTCCTSSESTPDETPITCCSSKPDSTSPPETFSDDNSPKVAETVNYKSQHDKRVRWNFSFSALKCQGSSTLWISSGEVVRPPSPIAWHPRLSLVSFISSLDESAFSLPLDRPDPPPRPQMA